MERAQADQQRISAPAVAPGAIAEAPAPYPDGDDDSDSDQQPTVEGASTVSPLAMTVDRGYTLAGWPPTAMPKSHLSDLPVRPPIA